MPLTSAPRPCIIEHERGNNATTNTNNNTNKMNTKIDTKVEVKIVNGQMTELLAHTDLQPLFQAKSSTLLDDLCDLTDAWVASNRSHRKGNYILEFAYDPKNSKFRNFCFANPISQQHQQQH